MVIVWYSFEIATTRHLPETSGLLDIPTEPKNSLEFIYPRGGRTALGSLASGYVERVKQGCRRDRLRRTGYLEAAPRVSVAEAVVKSHSPPISA